MDLGVTTGKFNFEHQIMINLRVFEKGHLVEMKAFQMESQMDSL